MSINLTPALRGQGLSKPLLEEAIKVFLADRKINLIARRNTTLARKRISCSLGFIQDSDSALVTLYERRAQ